MALYISAERLKDAIQRLANWRGAVRSQASVHLLTFLALSRKKVGYSSFIQYEEADDEEFFDEYFRVGTDIENPYFDPLSLKFRIKTHPHSNFSTARKSTFEKSWLAAESQKQDGKTYCKLADDAVAKIEQRVLRLKDKITRVNVIDLASWLFRKHGFPDDASSETLRDEFRSHFQMRDEDFDRLFEYLPEPSQKIFASQSLESSEEVALINQLRTEDSSEALLPLLQPAEQSDPPLPDDDSVLIEVQAVLALGSSGIILRGAPGTSKTWYSWQIALALTQNKPDRIYRVQFHPSYSYEDFIEGYIPDESSKSGFRVVDRIFLEAVSQAAKSQEPVVFIIDEINRGDPARIFGELLTYIENGWRGMEFYTKLGRKKISISRNLIVLATMNPHDRSITQLDMALLRRFDHIDIEPSGEQASRFLLNAGMSPTQANLVVDWFEELQKLLPFGIGHSYLLNVGDVGSLNLVWRYRIRPFCETILEFEQDRLEDVKRSFEALERRLRGIVE